MLRLGKKLILYLFVFFLPVLLVSLILFWRERNAPSLSAAKRNEKQFDWVSYYGSGNLAMLSRFGLIDIDAGDSAGNYTTADISGLKSSGSVVVSYLNIGACETFRSYWNQARAFSLGAYQGWPGEFWMDAGNPGWRDLIVDTVAPRLAVKGVQGFCLDNIELFQQFPNRPDIRAGIVDIVYRLRQKYPRMLIIAQNGIDILNDPGPDGRQFWQYINAEAHEEVSSTYDPYRKIDTAVSSALIDRLSAWKVKGLLVYTLDYAGDNSGLAGYDYRRSLAAGFHPYVSNKDLNKVYLWRFAAGSDRYFPGPAPAAATRAGQPYGA
ncbi:MAG: endo alpha-1,4 polygalactosaminidase [Actinobacteria bacterium]|nr:endo alpha-1,4 polygalactosaminidase [Actinomycetota bacterium]